MAFKEKNLEISFQDGNCGGHVGFPLGTILAIFDLQVTPILPIKFQVNCLSVHEKKLKYSPFGGHTEFLTDMTFSKFISTCRSDTSYQVSSRLASSGDEVQNKFSRWPPILAIF